MAQYSKSVFSFGQQQVSLLEQAAAMFSNDSNDHVFSDKFIDFSIFVHIHFKHKNDDHVEWLVNNVCNLYEKILEKHGATPDPSKGGIEHWDYHGHAGFAFFFLADSTSWADAVIISSDSVGSKEAVNRSNDHTKKVEEVEKRVNRHVKGLPDSNVQRIRFIAPGHVVPLLRRLRASLPFTSALGIDGKPKDQADDDFSTWFRECKYDHPKFIDAIIRIRGLSDGVPLYRFDQDVIFPPMGIPMNDQHWDHVGKLLCGSIQEHLIRARDPCAMTHWYSGHYVCDKLLDDKVKDVNKWDSWSGAFSTRACPALLATKELLHEDNFIGSKDFNPKPEHLNEATSDKVMRQFYIGESGKGGLISLGAHPRYALVSGAGFCESPSVSLDLPPWLHMREPVMWIDDHLRVALIRETKLPLPRNYVKSGFGNKSGAVCKYRSSPTNVARYTFELYLPTLLLGIAMDSWTTKEELKLPKSEVEGDPAKYEQSKYLPTLEEQLPLIQHIKLTLANGRPLTAHSRRKLHMFLKEAALVRWKAVLEEWSQLKGRDDTPTLASLWVTGKVKDQLERFGVRDLSNAPTKKKLDRGLGLLRSGSKDLNDADDLNPAMLLALNTLIEDVIEYISLLLRWPTFIQSIRSFEDSATRFDIAYMKERDRLLHKC